jgi:hypothetical protein
MSGLGECFVLDQSNINFILHEGETDHFLNISLKNGSSNKKLAIAIRHTTHYGLQFLFKQFSVLCSRNLMKYKNNLFLLYLL